METTKKVLSPEEQRVLETMQSINFGRIVDLEVKKGRPVVDARQKIVRIVRLGKDNGPRPELVKQDFVLKSRQVAFFEFLRCLKGDVKITVDVQYGLPERIQVFEESRI